MTTTFAIIILVAIAIALALLVAVRASIAAVASRVQQQLFENADHTGRIEAQSRQLKVSLEKLDRAFGEDATRARNEGVVHLRQVREALAADLKSQADELAGRVDRLGSELQQREGAVRQYLERVDAALERHGRATAEEAARTRGEAAAQARLMREEVTRHIKGHGDVMTERVAELTVALRNQQYDFHQQVGLLTQATERRMTELQQVFEKQLRRFEDGVDGRLEQMRAAVDEQVQATMDRGLGETFRDVRAQLESVQQNLKEMQQLASNVSDFRRVLTNVSSRGSWGVVRLSSLLEQSLSAGQYAADVKTKRDSDERVKFAVRLPGREAGDDRPVWLPIDAGFPLGAYQRLISARDGGDATEIDTVGAALENALTVRARAVGDKFLDPPFTTDFAVMFLPVEGLYAEVLRRQGLAE
jgi:DNA recombination protein RmuC